MNLVMACTTTSAPYSIGRSRIGVATVLSTISGTPCLCATFAHSLDVRNISRRISDALAIDRARIFVDQLLDVFGTVGFRKTRLDSALRKNVRQKRVGRAIKLRQWKRRCFPASAILIRAYSIAAIPELTLRPSTPPSSAATRFSSTVLVGLPIRV